MPKYTWFPGHMAKALREMKAKAKYADIVLEIRDARAPASTANSELDEIIKCKRRMVVLNKADLADTMKTKEFIAALEKQGHRAVATSVDNRHSVHNLLSSAVGWLKEERPTADANIMMVVGVPNCGKSSIINALKVSAKYQGQLSGKEAYHKTARTGPLPGVTLQMSGFQVCDAPRVYILDTPGVTLPNLKTDEIALRLAIIGAIKSSIVPEDEQVKALLRMLQPQQRMRALRAAMYTAPDPVPGPDGQLRDSRPSGTRKLARLLYDILSRHQQASSPHHAADGTPAGPGGWHPGLDDEPYDPEWQRLHELLCAYNVAGQRDPSRQQGVYSRVLKAYRSGHLGRFTWDEVAELEDGAEVKGQRSGSGRPRQEQR